MAQLANEIVGLESAIQSVKTQAEEYCHTMIIDYANNMCALINNELERLVYEINMTVSNPEVGNVFYDPKHANQYESNLIPNLTDAMRFEVVIGDDKLSAEIQAKFYNQNMTITDKVRYTIGQIAEMAVNNGKRLAGYSN